MCQLVLVLPHSTHKLHSLHLLCVVAIAGVVCHIVLSTCLFPQKQKRKRKSPPEAMFSALHLIHDPQDFAEKLFKKLEKSTEKFEVRLMLMALISRLIGVHQVCVVCVPHFLSDATTNIHHMSNSR